MVILRQWLLWAEGPDALEYGPPEEVTWIDYCTQQLHAPIFYLDDEALPFLTTFSITQPNLPEERLPAALFSRVGRLDIIRRYPQDLLDGYGTNIEINGATYYSLTGLYIKSMKVCADADSKLLIYVTRQDDTLHILEPEEFDFTFGELRIKLQDDRHPCLVTLHGLEFGIRSFSIEFLEGEVPLVNLQFTPSLKP